jgi:hypothetical protein
MEVAIGPDGLANIIFADNAGQATRAEYTRQTGGPVAKINPTSPTCLQQVGAPVPVGAVSRKTHTGVGDFDVNLLVPPTPAPGVGIECRSGGANCDFKVVISFAVPVTVNGNPKAQVTSGTGTVSNVTVNGAVVTVDLTGVTSRSRWASSSEIRRAMPVRIAVTLARQKRKAEPLRVRATSALTLTRTEW